jgi:hypothetical protein
MLLELGAKGDAVRRLQILFLHAVERRVAFERIHESLGGFRQREAELHQTALEQPHRLSPQRSGGALREANTI